MDTSSARQKIFDRIRQAQGRPPEVSSEERAAVADYLARHPAGPRPELPEDMLALFCEMAGRMSTTLDTVAAVDAAPQAIAAYLRANGLPTRAVAWPTLGALDWSGAGLDVEFRPPLRDVASDRENGDLVGITGCFCGIAETGSLVMYSGPETWASASLLPETHVAIIPVSRIFATMEDAFALVRAERGVLPRALNIISGPSRTGDIEQTIVLGAHGPYRVHLILVDDRK